VPAQGLLGEDEDSIHHNFESPAGRFDEPRVRLRKCLLELGRQTGGPGLIVSDDAVFNRDEHRAAFLQVRESGTRIVARSLSPAKGVVPALCPPARLAGAEAARNSDPRYIFARFDGQSPPRGWCLPSRQSVSAEDDVANINTRKGTIAILTGGGDVPGLNPAIRALTIRASREGYRVLGIRRGWAGLIEFNPDDPQSHG